MCALGFREPRRQRAERSGYRLRCLAAAVLAEVVQGQPEREQPVAPVEPVPEERELLGPRLVPEVPGLRRAR